MCGSHATSSSQSVCVRMASHCIVCGSHATSYSQSVCVRMAARKGIFCPFFVPPVGSGFFFGLARQFTVRLVGLSYEALRIIFTVRLVGLSYEALRIIFRAIFCLFYLAILYYFFARFNSFFSLA